jgi:hypothetical protein
VQEHAEAIRTLRARAVASVIQIGVRLQIVRDHIGRYCFQEWLASEFAWSQSTASRYMAIARCFRQAEFVEQFDYAALVALSRRKVSQQARDEALRLAAQGEAITKARALELIERLAAPETTRQIPLAQRVRRRLEKLLSNVANSELDAIAKELRDFLSRLERKSPGDADTNAP